MICDSVINRIECDPEIDVINADKHHD
jgi:hypothetical protein